MTPLWRLASKFGEVELPGPLLTTQVCPCSYCWCGKCGIQRLPQSIFRSLFSAEAREVLPETLGGDDLTGGDGESEVSASSNLTETERNDNRDLNGSSSGTTDARDSSAASEETRQAPESSAQLGEDLQASTLDSATFSDSATTEESSEDEDDQSSSALSSDLSGGKSMNFTRQNDSINSTANFSFRRKMKAMQSTFLCVRISQRAAKLECGHCERTFIRKSSFVAHTATHASPLQKQRNPRLGDTPQRAAMDTDDLANDSRSSRRSEVVGHQRNSLASLSGFELHRRLSALQSTFMDLNVAALNGSQLQEVGNPVSRASKTPVAGTSSESFSHQPNFAVSPSGSNLKRQLLCKQSRLLIQKQVSTFSCSHCKRSFMKRGNLMIHMRKHLEIRPFRCTFGKCRRQFSSAAALVAHARTAHLDEINLSFSAAGSISNTRENSKRRSDYQRSRKSEKAVKFQGDIENNSLFAYVDTSLVNQDPHQNTWSNARVEVEAAKNVAHAGGEPLKNQVRSAGPVERQVSQIPTFSLRPVIHEIVTEADETENRHHFDRTEAVSDSSFNEASSAVVCVNCNKPLAKKREEHENSKSSNGNLQQISGSWMYCPDCKTCQLDFPNVIFEASEDPVSPFDDSQDADGDDGLHVDSQDAESCANSKPTQVPKQIQRKSLRLCELGSASRKVEESSESSDEDDNAEDTMWTEPETETEDSEESQTEVPEGKWEYPKCALTELSKIDKILFWCWAGDGNGNKKREFFVHFRDKSYWDCTWVTEFYLRVYQPMRIQAYWKKWDNQVPPTVQDLEWMGGASLDENDPLTKQYYRYGVKPEWLQPQRVIAEKKCQGEHLYYVKWRELPYDCCTWEEAKDGARRILGFSAVVARYRAFNNVKEPSQSSKNGSFHAFVPPTRPSTDPKKHYKTQPAYLGVESKNLKLHPFQLEGLNWLRHSWSHKVNTILGDEMGLGKTIQAISFLYSLWKEGHSKGPFLVTAPFSTVLNWEREFEAWAPDFYVVTFTGFHESRKIFRQYELVHEEDQATNHNQLRVKGPVKFHVLLTSYEFISKESTCLGSINWQVIVVDEAHRLRKVSNLFFRKLSDYQVKYKLLLTGTPLQNRLDELFFLLNFLEPAQFGDLEVFLREFEDVSKQDQVKKLHEKLQHHMLRRFKADVFKDMPGKAEVIVRVEMTPFQKKYYKYILTKNFAMLKAQYKSSERLLALFVHLIKCCNHPYLFPASIEEHDRMYANDEDRQQKALVEASGKLVLLQRMLKMLKEEGRRVLIFSQMTKVLDILEDFLEMEGYEYERLDGNITGETRQNSIDRFNAPGACQFVFLISTRAGGLGINLATADTVIIYDSDWNPHNDVQALSRAHRIGQQNKVMIYRFVTHNTVEEKVMETAKTKMMLNTLIVRKFFSKEEMNDIIRFGTKKLFGDNSNENVEIHYTDEKLKQLLDRSAVKDTQDSSEQGGFNDYLNSFKLANYAVLEGSEKPGPDTDDAANENTSSGYWKTLQEQQMNDENSSGLDNNTKGTRHKGERLKYNTSPRKCKPYSPEAMKNAEKDVINGIYPRSVAAKIYGVPYNTLYYKTQRSNMRAMQLKNVKANEPLEAGSASAGGSTVKQKK